jgi:hypothetical protein
VNRRVLTDGSGGWFNLDNARVFDELTRWNGNEYLSKATGSQWAHENLYRTAAGIYVLHHWSDWPGSTESYSEVTASGAAAWLSRNEYDQDATEEQFR